MEKVRVLHTPMNSGGHPIGLAEAEKRAGISSSVITLSKHKFGYHSHSVLWDDARSRLGMELKRLSLIKRAIKDFDIIHYNSGTTIAAPILPPDRHQPSKHNFYVQWMYHNYLSAIQKLELAMLKRAKKGIVVTFQGSDARQGDYCKDNYEIHTNVPGNGYYSIKSDKYKRDRIRLFDCYADRIYALNPDIMNVLPERADFIPYASVDIQDWKPVNKPCKKPIRIVHAPSNRKMKGTKYLVEAVERLRKEGLVFEFELVENQTREAAKSAYENADILVDQLLVGWYGGLAVELMALGKPVICYIREGDMEHLPEAMQQQSCIINANPMTIYKVLKDCILNYPVGFESKSLAARNYVETWHDPDKIAKVICQDYLDIMRNKGNTN